MKKKKKIYFFLRCNTISETYYYRKWFNKFHSLYNKLKYVLWKTDLKMFDLIESFIFKCLKPSKRKIDIFKKLIFYSRLHYREIFFIVFYPNRQILYSKRNVIILSRNQGELGLDFYISFRAPDNIKILIYSQIEIKGRKT